MILGINAGSFLLRNTEWTWDFLSELWATIGSHVWMSKDWWEQVWGQVWENSKNEKLLWGTRSKVGDACEQR